jgi:hypothetical protein
VSDVHQLSVALHNACLYQFVLCVFRGLPHAHILIILAPEHKFRTPEDYDRVVCAELPDAQVNPRLYEIVTSNMLHGPCGPVNPNSPCMVDGECSKKYPRAFSETTVDSNDSYPVYRRRDDGRYHEVTTRYVRQCRLSLPYLCNI